MQFSCCPDASSCRVCCWFIGTDLGTDFYTCTICNFSISSDLYIMCASDVISVDIKTEAATDDMSEYPDDGMPSAGMFAVYG